MALPRFRIVVNTFERGTPWPVVTHIFHGESFEKAFAILKAHKKSDAFLRDCSEQEVFQKTVCKNKTFYQRREKKRWVTLKKLEGGT